MKIGFASFDFGLYDGRMSIGGSGWYRMALPAAALSQLGHECWIGTLMQHPSTNELLVCPTDNRDHAVGGFDLIVLQRWMNHELPDAISRARAQGQIVVQDLDDWFWGLDPRNRAHRATDPKIHPLSNREHYRRSIGRSTAVTVSTPYLAERAEQMFPHTKVVLIRNAIDLDRWTPHDETPDEPHVLGWVGAIPWRSGDLESLRGVVGPWCETNGWRFHHGGHLSHITHHSAGEVLECPDFSYSDFETIDKYPTLFEPLDVGIVPLNDIPFNNGKSAIKGLEYAASGVPWIASPSAEYRWLNKTFKIGRVAKRAADWRRELNRMLDPAWRADQRAQNLELVKQFDFALHAKDWADAYSHLVLTAT